MSKRTWILAAGILLMLVAIIAWKRTHRLREDPNELADKGLYKHQVPAVPARQVGRDSFSYVRAKETVQVASSDPGPGLPPELQKQLRIKNPKVLKGKGSKEKERFAPVPALQQLLEMMPAERGVPHVTGTPQLIPQSEPSDGAPLDLETSTAVEKTPSKETATSPLPFAPEGKQ